LVVRGWREERGGQRGRNDPNIVCTHKLKRKKRIGGFFRNGGCEKM
jgi:hypothetical protein